MISTDIEEAWPCSINRQCLRPTMFYLQAYLKCESVGRFLKLEIYHPIECGFTGFKITPHAADIITGFKYLPIMQLGCICLLHNE